MDCDLEALVRASCSYEKGGVVVGRRAASLAPEHPRDAIVSVKRFMGRGADDPETTRLGPYEFVPATPGEPNTVRFKVAEARRHSRRGERGDPAHAQASRPRTSSQRRAARSSRSPRTSTTRSGRRPKTPARLAGLEVLRLLNEPTAAALAYGLEKKQNGTFAVYDLGGGTFDVTVLVLDDGVFQVRSTGGDSQLGGDDMDRAIAHELLAVRSATGAGAAAAETAGRLNSGR